MNKKEIGLYLHIPFCASKCPYCDFYSSFGKEETKQQYSKALIEQMTAYSNRFNCKANTLYIGGGTPSVLPPLELKKILEHAESTFLVPNSEITVECNPYKLSGDFFETLKNCKVNRLSIGLQSADDTLRRKLGRRASREDVKSVILAARAAEIQNISLDVMLGIPDSTQKDLKETLDFCIRMDVPHISCYILRLEENTYFYKHRDSLNLPDDDAVADMYLFMCEYLKQHGICQYEISNFAKPGFESRHNLKYWHCEEYLGLGPAAHSFIEGKRFYFPRDMEYFMAGKEPIADGEGGDYAEYAMLALRLCEGLSETDSKARFGHGIPKEMRQKAEIYAKNGFLILDAEGIRMTPKGFLVSNTILADIL